MHKHFQHVLDDIHNFSFYTHLNPTSSMHRAIGNKSQINRLLTKGEENETQTTWNQITLWSNYTTISPLH